MNYLDNLDKDIKEYFNVLEPKFPTWLIKYIETKEMLKQKYISITCGTIYSDLFESEFFFSSLDHSVAVALIIWHFTHDKKQTLSGLFHDIATPVFKHCIDCMYGDYMTQESTEDLTTKIIQDSKEIMKLLKEDNILLSEVDDYHIYPIADNDTPKLSSDRLEYSLSNALFTYRLMDIDEIKEIYDDIYISYNEENNLELAFKNIDIANKFVSVTTRLSTIYREDRTIYTLQFLSDIIKGLLNDNVITMDDLYNLKEEDIIKIIRESKYKEVYNIWVNTKKVKNSEIEPNDSYYTHHGLKIRYINPLVGSRRVYDISDEAKTNIDNNLNNKRIKYVYIDGIKKFI